MNDSLYKNRSNLLKGIGTLCVFIIFGYYAYQDSINRKMLERSLNENAASPQRDFSHESSRLQRPHMEMQFIRMWLQKLSMQNPWT